MHGSSTMQHAPRRSLALADHVRDPPGSQAALSMTSTFAKEHRVDFLGLPLLPTVQQPDAAGEVLLSCTCLIASTATLRFRGSVGIGP